MCGVWLIREEECGLQNYKGKKRENTKPKCYIYIS